MTDLSTFDPEVFMNTETETSLATSYEVVPEGDWLGVVDSTKVRKVDTQDGQRAVMDVNWVILDEEVRKITEMERPMARQGIFLDINEKGTVDRGKGKNVRLGKLLDALGMNASKKWAPSHLVGAQGKVTVSHSPNPNDPENPYANVTRVASA